MTRKSWMGLLVAAGLLASFVGFLGLALRVERKAGHSRGKLASSLGGDKIGILPLNGVITESDKFIERIIDFRDDASIKAVILRIDSPGGGVGPSQEIYEEIRKLDAKKPVIASVASLCASGGYYAAVGARRIFSNPGSLVGSIGVIMPLYNAEELFAWAKVKPQFVKSGKMKDVGNPARAMTDEERVFLQALVDNTHAQFVTAVSEGRKAAGMTTAAVAAIADGRVFTGKQAIALGLVDEMGDMRDAVAYAGKLVKIEGEPQTTYPKEDKKNLADFLFERSESALKNALMGGLREAGQGAAAPSPMFLWNP